MADEKKNQTPAWQQAQAQAEVEPPVDTSRSNDANASEATEATIEQARKFLNDENVRSHSVEKKIEFLKSKGFSGEQIQALLGETEQEQASEAGTPKSEAQETAPSAPPKQEGSPTTSSSTTTEPRGDLPPIITYPEFLTTSPKPPPLITPSRLLNILTVSGSAWTLLYGTARYLVNPMVGDLNDARSDYHSHVSEKLGELVERLEEVVSEVPYKDKDGRIVLKLRAAAEGGGGGDRGGYEDNESTFSDPTELFHRDFGTQTSTPPPESVAHGPPAAAEEKENPIDRQASRLSALRTSLRELNDMYVRRAEDSAELDGTLRSIRDDVDNLAFPTPSPYSYSSSDYLSSRGGPNGADDEFRRTKDAIRGVKGMFLSTRSFPAVAAAR